MNYTLKVNGRRVPVYETTVYPPPYNHNEKMAFAIVLMDEPTDFELTSVIPIETVTIRPLRLGMKAEYDEHTIRIHMDKPEKISVEINGSYKNNIVLWASAPRDEGVSLAAEKIIYRCAGEYKGDINITEDNTVLYLDSGVVLQGRVIIKNANNVTVYLAKDSIIHGKFHIENSDNLKVCGFGCICCERFARHDGKHQYQFEARFCKNLTIHDVSFLNSCNWTCRIFGCDNVYIDNINIVGCRGNSDGVDICGTRNALVEHCFIRTWDDCFVAKAFDTGNLENVLFRDSTLWNDFARPLEIGVEIRADYARNIKFENIDILHSVTGYPLMGIHHGDRGKLRNIVFDNIRIEDAPGAQIFDVRITNSVWNEDNSMGDIDGLTIKNIYLGGEQEILPSRSRLEGYSEECMVRNVTLENISFCGKYATTLEECHVNVMDFVENVQLKYPEGEPKLNIVHSEIKVLKPFVFGEDGLYDGTVEITLENRNDVPICGKAKLQICPVNMADLDDPSFPFDLAAGQSVSKQYELKLQPGKYLFCVQASDPAVEFKWHYEELRLPLASSIENAPAYKIVNYYGDKLEGVKLAAKNNTLIIQSEALRNNTFTIYSASPAEYAPGEVKFTVEETDFGEAMAIMDGRNGLEEAPQLRCPAEITYVFKNEPKVKRIVKNVVGGCGSDIVEIPFADLDIEDGGRELWFDVIADLPEVKDYRYAFAMFHSVQPRELAHMFARADVQD